jgi:hypothetical protein
VSDVAQEPVADAPLLQAHSAPPTDYYAANLRRLLEHVLAFHRDLLEPDVYDYARRLQASSRDAQRLFARLIVRKGPWLRVDKLRYPELEDVDAALRELEALGVLVLGGPAPADALLKLLTTPERRSLYPQLPASRRDLWITRCVSAYSDAAIRARLARRYRWLALAGVERFQALQTLFFGDDRQDTSTFVLEDLGLLRYPRYLLKREDRLFARRSDFLDYLRLRRLSALSHRLEEHPRLAAHLSAELWSEMATRYASRQRDRLLNRLGRHFERRGEFDAALCCYGRSSSHPARERRVRLLVRLGDEAGGRRLADRMRSEPRAAEEVDFAARFPKRRGSYQPVLKVVPLRGAIEERIERHAARLLGADGGEVWHLENHFPLTLAGLAYWDVVMSALPGAFVNPYQAAPLDLFWPDFAGRRAEALAELEARFRVPGQFRETVRESFRRHEGTASRLVSWWAFSKGRLDCLLRCIPEAELHAVASHVIRQPYRARTGFPDLTVIYAPGHYEFVEVKGPTDALQAPQRVWLDVLGRLSVPARVLKFTA